MTMMMTMMVGQRREKTLGTLDVNLDRKGCLYCDWTIEEIVVYDSRVASFLPSDIPIPVNFSLSCFQRS